MSVLEPSALGEGLTASEAAQRSIAVSLKRIADQLATVDMPALAASLSSIEVQIEQKRIG